MGFVDVDLGPSAVTVGEDLPGVVLGDGYVDRYTGYEGVATARTEYLRDAPSVRLERADENGRPEECWFSEARLEPRGNVSRRVGMR